MSLLNLLLFFLTLLGLFPFSFGVSPCDDSKCTTSPGFDSSKCNSIHKQMQILCPCRPGYIKSFACSLCDTRIAYTNFVGTTRQCTMCNCNDAGSADESCNKGICTCKEGFSGDKCDACAPGYSSDFPNCRKCKCFPLGTVNSANGTCISAQDSQTTCRCLPGYTGADCSSCAPGFFKQPGDKSCKLCDCEANNTESSSQCDPLTGKCVCKSGFGGNRCDQCDLGLNTYPNCSGSFFNNHKDGAYGVIGAAFIVAGLFYLLRRANPEGHNFLPFSILINISSFIANLLFLRDITISPIYYKYLLWIIAVLVPMVLNLILAGYIISKEYKRNDQFREWMLQNQTSVAGITLLAVINVELMEALSCGVFKLDALSAPLRKTTLQRRIPLCGMAKIILADLLMFIVEVVKASYMGSGKRDMITFLSLCLTGFLLLHAFISRVLLCFIISQDRAWKKK